MSNIKSERNYGIDLLKVISMFMVVVLHILGQGGILHNTLAGSMQHKVAWLMEFGCYCAVNCFALTTGYLMVGRPFKYRKIVPLWLTVFFYTILIWALTIIFTPEYKLDEYPFYFLPAISGEYWYFTAYFCLFFFIPFFNTLIEILSKRSYYVLLLTGFLLFCITHIISINNMDCFGTNNGYSTWWLMYLYLLGAGIKKYNMFSKITVGWALLGYVAMVLITWLSKMAIGTIINSGISVISYYAGIYKDDRLMNYISPTILLAAMFLMLFCIRLTIPNFLKIPLAFLSPLVFQVYLIHTNPIVWEFVLGGRFIQGITYNPVKMVLYVLGVAVIIFAVCVLIDLLRYYLFRWLKVNKAVDTIADKIVCKFNEKTKVS